MYLTCGLELDGSAEPNEPLQLIGTLLMHAHMHTLNVAVAQAAITSSRGFFEEKHESQTIKMWSLVPAQRFQMVNTFEARARIMGLSWRPTADGGYQVARWVFVIISAG